MCPRCSGVVTAQSFFAIHVWAKDGQLYCDTVVTRQDYCHGFLMHLSADRECKGEISGYIGKLLKNLDLPATTNTTKLVSL